VGFCGSLTTFSGWVLALSRALAGANGMELSLRLSELLAGVAAAALGKALARIRR
jgi:CrcB protein